MQLSRNVERVWRYHTNTISKGKGGDGDKKSSLLGRQASQTAFRLPLKTGEPVPLFGLQEKGWRHLRPPFHIGRAVPAGISEFTVFANWRQNKKTRKILESEKEKTTIIAYNQGGVTGVRESFKTE